MIALVSLGERVRHDHFDAGPIANEVLPLVVSVNPIVAATFPLGEKEHQFLSLAKRRESDRLLAIVVDLPPNLSDHHHIRTGSTQITFYVQQSARENNFSGIIPTAGHRAEGASHDDPRTAGHSVEGEVDELRSGKRERRQEQ